MRRKPGQLLDLEVRILTTMVQGGAAGDDIHGFALARSLADHAGSKCLTSHGTLYKAWAGREAQRALSSVGQQDAPADHGGAPARRLNPVTAEGGAVLRAHAGRSADVRYAPGELGIE